MEHMRGLQQLPPTGFRFFAVPPKVRAFGTFQSAPSLSWAREYSKKWTTPVSNEIQRQQYAVHLAG